MASREFIRFGDCSLLTLTRWVRLVLSLRGTWSGTFFSASSRDYGIPSLVVDTYSKEEARKPFNALMDAMDTS